MTWDSKVLTVVALLNGVQDLVRERMQQDGIYDEFIRIAEVCSQPKSSNSDEGLILFQREYSMVFDELKGEDVELCLPKAEIRDAGLEDFTLCA